MTDAPDGRNDPPVVSVIVPVRNGAATIAGTVRGVLRNLEESGLTGEVIVVDDASTDETATVLAALANLTAPVRCIRRDMRGGPNASRNAGVLASTANVLAFVDGDDEPLSGWLGPLVRAVDDPGALASGTYVARMRGGRTVEYLPHVRRAFGYPSIVGGNMAMHRGLFDRVGGFDENIMRGGTEVEFCIRAQALFGATVVPVPEARVKYRMSGSLVGRWRTEYGRQRGHAYVERSLRLQGIDARLADDLREADGTSRTKAWKMRASRAGWPLFLAGLGGRVSARVAGFLPVRRTLPARRGVVSPHPRMPSAGAAIDDDG